MNSATWKDGCKKQVQSNGSKGVSGTKMIQTCAVSNASQLKPSMQIEMEGNYIKEKKHNRYRNKHITMESN